MITFGPGQCLCWGSNQSPPVPLDAIDSGDGTSIIGALLMTHVGGSAVVLGVVLCMPWQGRFMCPFAMAGLGFEYFNTKFSLMLGHPRMNPRQIALRSVEMHRSPNDWWANLTAFTLVLMEWVNNAMLGFSGTGWLGTGGTAVNGICCSRAANSNFHNSVDLYWGSVKIILPSYHTTHLHFLNTTIHPALHNGRMPKSNMMAKLGTICPTRGLERPGTTTSHVCIDCTLRPLGRLTVNGCVASLLLATGTHLSQRQMLLSCPRYHVHHWFLLGGCVGQN